MGRQLLHWQYLHTFQKFKFQIYNIWLLEHKNAPWPALCSSPENLTSQNEVVWKWGQVSSAQPKYFSGDIRIREPRTASPTPDFWLSPKSLNICFLRNTTNNFLASGQDTTKLKLHCSYFVSLNSDFYIF